MSQFCEQNLRHRNESLKVILFLKRKTFLQKIVHLSHMKKEDINPKPFTANIGSFSLSLG
jgi:hypothetical protein